MHGPFSSVVAAAGALGETGPGALYAVTLSGGSDAATLILSDAVSGATPALWATIKAAAATTVTVEFPGGLGFGTGCYATITGTTPSVGVLYS